MDRAGARAEVQPNVVVITVDTLRQDHLGAYGGDVATPALDRLAAEGFRFLDVFSTAPTTLPSHTSLFTGNYPARHGVVLNGRYRVPPQARTLAEVLVAEGYRTAAFVGSAVLDKTYGLDQGFETYDDDFTSSPDSVQEQRRAEEVSRSAIEWLRRVEPPFFLWVHYFDPHGPYDPPPPWDGSYYEGDPRDPTNRSMDEIDPVFYQRLEGITDIEYPRAQYRAEVSYTDSAIGSLLESLAATDAAEDTLVVMTADHGESLGENNYYFDHGNTLHDSSLRVPLLIRVPWLEGGRTASGPVSLVDLYPTVLELLHLPGPANVQGKSLVPYLEGELLPAERTIFFETHLPVLTGGTPIIGMRKGDWKLIMWPSQAALFDMARDPGERVNLAREREPIVEMIGQELLSYLDIQPMTTVQIEPDEAQVEKLRALGYIR
ncbi:MAG: sulfatase [Acidobacteria bacterium]|nr:sulfatase [Acidobacteriota bacterium]